MIEDHIKMRKKNTLYTL